MSRNPAFIVIASILTVACFVAASVTVQQTIPLPVGDGGEVVQPDTFSLTTLLSLLGSGSFLATIFAVWKQIQPFLQARFPNVPLPPADVVKTSTTTINQIEFVDAAIAYAQDRKNLPKQARFTNAALQEIRDCYGDKSEIAKALNLLAVAIVNEQFKPKPPAVVEA